MLKPGRIAVWTLGAAALGLLGVSISCSGKAAGGSGPGKGKASGPVPVLAAPAAVKDVPVEIRTFGSAEPSACVTVRAQVSGELKEVHFAKGQELVQGAMLFTIDTKPYEIALEQARAALARNEAMLANAARDAEREQKLLEKKVSSETERDRKVADKLALEAAVQVDKAAVKEAQLQLDRCRITSPLAGRAGALLVDRGNLVKANDVALVTINQTRPLEVRFEVPQGELPAVRKAMAERKAAGGYVEVQAVVPGDQGRRETGKLTFIDNAVNPNSGTVQMRAEFRNVDADGKDLFWPGEYLRVVLVVGTEKGATVVPSQAVQTGRDGRYVYVIGADTAVALRPVTLRRTVGSEAIVEGLAPGEQVVTDGHVRLKAGVKTKVELSLGRPASGGAGTGSQPASRPARK